MTYDDYTGETYRRCMECNRSRWTEKGLRSECRCVCGEVKAWNKPLCRECRGEAEAAAELAEVPGDWADWRDYDNARRG